MLHTDVSIKFLAVQGAKTFQFSGASSHLCKRRSVGPSVGSSVGPSRFCKREGKSIFLCK